MDSSESHEPSYYEVALTNRQVLIAFVALLVCLVVAFLSGVWIGRGDLVLQAAAPAASEPAPGTEPPLEQLSFFNGRDAGTRAPAPSPAKAAPATAATSAAAAPTREDPSGGEAMRQNLEATIAANRAPAPAGTRPSAAEKPAAQPAASSPSPAKPAAAVPAGRHFVQVYSSTNGARAKEIVAQLQRAGFVVQLAEMAKAGPTQFRVRVGPYENRAKADTAAARLRREFRLDTWITDTP